MYRAELRWQPIAILLGLSLVWGANWGIVKMTSGDVAPLFMAALRSLVAAVCLYVWMKAKGIVIFPSRAVLVHGVVIGVLFGVEFGLVYAGLSFTLASRTYVLLYSAPFFVALGAHLFLQGDRLHRWKVAGLVLAFAGVVTLFVEKLGKFSLDTLPGDLMALLAAVAWGATTVYIKRYVAHRTVPLQTLFYQVLFSAPLLFGLSWVLEDRMVTRLTLLTGFSMFYQCILVAFLSYLVWFELVHRYPVSLLHAFSFFTPVIGVFLGGALLLQESMTGYLLTALVLVSLGLVLVNHQPAPHPAARPDPLANAGPRRERRMSNVE